MPKSKKNIKTKRPSKINWKQIFKNTSYLYDDIYVFEDAQKFLAQFEKLNCQILNITYCSVNILLPDNDADKISALLYIIQNTNKIEGSYFYQKDNSITLLLKRK